MNDRMTHTNMTSLHVDPHTHTLFQESVHVLVNVQTCHVGVGHDQGTTVLVRV